LPPRDLKNIARPELMRRVTRADNYKQWTKDFPAELEYHSIGAAVNPSLPSRSLGAVRPGDMYQIIGAKASEAFTPAGIRVRCRLAIEICRERVCMTFSFRGVDSNLWFRNSRHAAQERPL